MPKRIVMSKLDASQEKLLDAIVQRATMDTSFRQQLLAAPRDAIKAAFGVQIPETFRVKFVEKGADLDALVVLPDVKNSGDELSDDDLEAVAGGTDTTYAWDDGKSKS